MLDHRYQEVWAVDFEFTAPDGHRADPICMVAKELLSGRVIRLAREELHRLDSAPFNTGPDTLFLAFYASAEFGCFIALGWPLPINVIDLHAEFRNMTNGLAPPHGNNLLGALLAFGLPPGDAVEKREMRELAKRGAPFTAAEMRALIDYCGHDVQALAQLWPVMEPHLDKSALLRGAYMKAAASIEWTGVPIDRATLTAFGDRWSDLKLHIASVLDPSGEVWEGTRFKQDRFRRWLQKKGISWPRLPSGALCLKKEIWADMAVCHPEVKPLAILRATLGQLRLNDLAVGPDGHNRAPLSAFRSKTGRNQPSSKKFIFGLPRWLRPLITPDEDTAAAYIDWAQQEFGIGAFLSGDLAMQEAYLSSDPYIAFAIQAGAAPHGATKDTHPQIRNIFKMVVLGVGYGMSAHGLASRLGVSRAYAEELLALHRKCYPKFWRWMEAAVDFAQFNGSISARFGWCYHLAGFPNIRSLANFPCQANGAEMMRLAAIYATREGIQVCATVHDAYLIKAPKDEIGHRMARMGACMERASADVLGGFKLKTDEPVPIRHPDRFGDPQNPLWRLATAFVASPSSSGDPHPCPAGDPRLVY